MCSTRSAHWLSGARYRRRSFAVPQRSSNGRRGFISLPEGVVASPVVADRRRKPEVDNRRT